MNDAWLKHCGGYLVHHGVKGMKWGVRKDKLKSGKKSGKLDYDLQFFAYKPKKPFKFRNSKEAEIVRQTLNPNNIPKDKLKLDVLDIEINIDDQGAYRYTCKNQDGNGAFWPIARTKIKDSATGVLERNNDADRKK